MFFKLETVQYEHGLNGYRVLKTPNSLCVKNVKSLAFPHPLSSLAVQNNKYVPLINHDHVEFY